MTLLEHILLLSKFAEQSKSPFSINKKDLYSTYVVVFQQTKSNSKALPEKLCVKSIANY